MNRLICVLGIVTLTILHTNAEFSRLRNSDPLHDVGDAVHGDLFSTEKQILEL